MKLTIYHNPRCSKSRKTLELLEENGIRPTIRRYLEEPPTADELIGLAGSLDRPLRELLRTGEDEFRDARDALALDDDAALAAWLADHPRVIERPVVIDEDSGRAVLGRPPENVLALIGRRTSDD